MCKIVLKISFENKGKKNKKKNSFGFVLKTTLKLEKTNNGFVRFFLKKKQDLKMI